MTRVNLGPARCVDMRGEKGVIRGKTWRWKKRISWGGCEGGSGSTCVAGETDSFEISHFGCGVGGGARDCPFEEGDAVGGKRGLAFVKASIRLKTNCAEVRCVATGQNSNGNIGSLW